MMKQKLLKTIALGLMALVGVNAWAQTNLLEADGVSISWTPKDGSATSLTYSSGITFTPGNSAEFALNIEFTGVTIDASNAFVIVEASNGALGTEVKKLRNINIDNVVYEYFPTLNDNIYMVAPSGYKYRFRVFKDGGHPNAGGKTNDAGSGSTTNWYGTYNRNLVAGYSSMMLPYEVSYNDLNAAGLTTYTFGAISGSTVTFNKLTTGTIAAHTPFIVKAETAGVHLIPSNGVISDWSTIETWYKDNNYAIVGASDCYYIGSFIDEVPGSTTAKGWPDGVTSSTHDFYGILPDGSGFAKMDADTKTTYYRAFIADNRGSGARSLILSFDDEATAINSIHETAQSNNVVYNLQGVQMNNQNLTKGIYVKNGKKFIVK